MNSISLVNSAKSLLALSFSPNVSVLAQPLSA